MTRRHWIDCLYCRGSHPTESAWRECADKVIAAETEEYRRDHAEMAVEDTSDCCEADLPHPEFWNPAI